MSNAPRRSESPAGAPTPGTASRPGPYESPRRVLRGYDQPASVPARDRRDAPVPVGGGDARR